MHVACASIASYTAMANGFGNVSLDPFHQTLATVAFVERSSTKKSAAFESFGTASIPLQMCTNIAIPTSRPSEPQAPELDYSEVELSQEQVPPQHIESYFSGTGVSIFPCVNMESLCLNEFGYTFVDPLPDKYLCGICKSVLNEPHVTECCGQHFCKNCLEESENPGNFPFQRQSVFGGSRATKCPHCRQINFRHFRYLPFKREIDSLKVYCPRKSSGCNVQLDYADKNKHEEICEYVHVYCKCRELVIKKDLCYHEQNVCILRKSACKLCGQIGEYIKIESSEHHSICPDVLQNCPNSCRAQFKRKDAKSHNSICPEAMVACDFAEAGCQATPKRKDLESHMDTNMKQHLCQLMKAHGAIICEHASMKKQHEIMKTEHEIMKEENATIKREFNEFKEKRKRRCGLAHLDRPTALRVDKY